MPSPNNPDPALVIEPEKEDVEVDLDNFLNFKSNSASENQATAVALEMPKADRLVVVGFGVDDSGSLDGLESAVRSGLELAVKAFKGAKGSDFYLIVRGFEKTYFQGFIDKITPQVISAYQAYYGSTPLITLSIDLMKQVRKVANNYRNAGIPTTVAALIITDGLPNSEYYSPNSFAEYIQATDYIVGMGIRGSDSDAGADVYKQLFKDMGIKTPAMTPKSDPATVRHAINQFSQSVASVASGAVAGAGTPTLQPVTATAAGVSNSAGGKPVPDPAKVPKKKPGRLF